MSKYSPWFPPEVKPVRKGWYQRDYGLTYAGARQIHFSYWDGQYFSLAFGVIPPHKLQAGSEYWPPPASNKARYWRGLSKPTGGK
jgi:hypothetical protein